MNNINELGNQTDTSSSSDAVALSPSAMVVQSTQPSTVLVLVPSTSETVVSSTSTTFRKFKSYFFVHFVCNMCICIYICFGWLEFNNKLALPNGKPQNLLYLFASHKTCCIYLQSCNMVLGGRGAVCTPFMKAIYTPL
nr:uncharacterized protein LOC124806107 isoform X14 [Hydra vulgaris]